MGWKSAMNENSMHCAEKLVCGEEFEIFSGGSTSKDFFICLGSL